MNPYTLQISRLEEELEAMRQRAEAAEAALGMGTADWNRAVKPLSLQTTRIMRLLAVRDMTCDEMAGALIRDYPDMSKQLVRIRMSQIRPILPWELMPTMAGYYRPYSVKDRDALKAFLATGELPQVRRAA